MSTQLSPLSKITKLFQWSKNRSTIICFLLQNRIVSSHPTQTFSIYRNHKEKIQPLASSSSQSHSQDKAKTLAASAVVHSQFPPPRPAVEFLTDHCARTDEESRDKSVSSRRTRGINPLLLSRCRRIIRQVCLLFAKFGPSVQGPFLLVEVARKFVEELLEEGSKVACDETNQGFNGNFGKLPEFYDEEKYNRLVLREREVVL